MFCSLLLSAALAAGPAVREPTEAEVERDRLREELGGVQAERDAAAAARDGAVRTAEELDRERDLLLALLAHAEVLLDDRRPLDERVAAAEALAATGDPRALPFLRAASARTEPLVQEAAVDAALTFDHPESAEPARVALADRHLDRDLRVSIVDRLGAAQTPSAAGALWGVVVDREARARVRAASVDELRTSYPSALADFGEPPPIADAFGATTFITASGLAGGILLSSFGVWGQFDAGPALGAVGGSAIGLGAGALYTSGHPMTAGDGLAFASGVSFGLAYGAWTTTAVHGAWRTQDFQEKDRTVEPAAAWRALGVLGGGAIGAWSVSKDPTAWDVMEVDTATYLGSAIALGAAGLVLYHPEETSSGSPTGSSSFTATTSGFTRPRGGEGHDEQLRLSQQLAVAELVGATAGLATGAWLVDGWELDWRDGAFASVLAAEGAWAGAWTPALVASTDPDLKGYVRLPLHAFAAGGLALAEATHPSYARSLSTGFGATIGNALGAGLPLMAGYDDDRSIAVWMVPMGLAGAAGGFLVEPWVAPTAGDAAMIGVGTSIAGSAGLLVGHGLREQGVWIDDSQATGLGAVTVGAAGLGSYALASRVDPRVDEMLVVGSGAAWGGGFGALIPLAAGTGEDVILFSAAGAELGGGGVAGLALAAGLAPRDTLVPQLVGLSGGTVGALVAGLTTNDENDVALGAVLGATAGLGLGAVAELVLPDGPSRQRTASFRSEALVLPTFGQQPGADGGVVPTVGLQVVGW